MQTKIDIGGGERIPTLSALFTLVKDVPIILNVELKGPASPSRKANFDYLKTVQVVNKMIRDFDLEDKVIISSFVPEIISTFSEVLKKQQASEDYKNFLE